MGKMNICLSIKSSCRRCLSKLMFDTQREYFVMEEIYLSSGIIVVDKDVV